jgi:phage recombination protein Bet
MNPLAGDAYLVKYGEQASIITSVDFFLKRANSYPNYDGYEAEFGKDGDEITATCRVWFKDRQRPVSVTVYMSEYNTGRSLWSKGGKPRTMLEKVAICQAHRRAFPDAFQGVYEESELQKQPAVQEERKPVTMNELLEKAKAVESPKSEIECELAEAAE